MKVPTSVAVFLTLGLLAASQSGNIIRLADASPIAITAWRLTMATFVLALLTGPKLRTLALLTLRERVLLVLAGVTLAMHFFAWIAAVQHTTVANAAVFFAINPVFTATAGHLIYRERITPKLIVAIAIGLVGVAIPALSDLRLGSEHLLGDGLAVLCGLLFTIYFLLGKGLLRRLDSSVYVTALYGTAALFSLAVMGVAGIPFTGYTGRTWAAFGLMALVPTLIGHTSMNFALRYIDAGRIATLTLSEPLLAGVVAYLVWDEPLRAATGAGYLLICASVILVLTDRPPAHDDA